MAQVFSSLLVIMLAAVAAPVVARLVPGQVVPETVLLLLAGAVLGPNMLGIIHESSSIELMSELGMAFLFLLAGYEIDPKMLTGAQGRAGLGAWVVSFAIAYGLASLVPGGGPGTYITATLAIALTTTALGALVPILRERGLSGTTVGASTLAFGTWGELGPVLAISVLLSVRKAWQTALVLLLLLLTCVLIARHGARVKRQGTRLFRFFESKANSTSQTFVRLTVLLLIALVAFSAIFDLDIVLGAFAAGFVLRYVVPEGNEQLERKIEAIGYGFLIPIFFVVSGAGIDLASVAAHPWLLVAFIVALLAVRSVPVFVALRLCKETRQMSGRSRASISLYCTAALPLIVAVTSLAVDAEAISEELAGIMVAAGALSMFLMPFLAQLMGHVADAQPSMAAHEIQEHPSQAMAILREHFEVQRMMGEDLPTTQIVERVEHHAAQHAERLDEHKRRLAAVIDEQRRRREQELSKTDDADGTGPMGPSR